METSEAFNLHNRLIICKIYSNDIKNSSKNCAFVYNEQLNFTSKQKEIIQNTCCKGITKDRLLFYRELILGYTYVINSRTFVVSTDSAQFYIIYSLFWFLRLLTEFEPVCQAANCYTTLRIMKTRNVNIIMYRYELIFVTTNLVQINTPLK